MSDNEANIIQMFFFIEKQLIGYSLLYNDLFLFDIQYQSLEVLTLGMIDIDRVVGRLCELMEDAHLATRLCSGCKYR
jgi:hypothetical protein